MKSYYTRHDLESMRAAGIICNNTDKPTSESLYLINRNHKCEVCEGTINYQSVDDSYCFVCQVCNHISYTAALKSVYELD
jgi:hypothetical protein